VTVTSVYFSPVTIELSSLLYPLPWVGKALPCAGNFTVDENRHDDFRFGEVQAR
jgi:hypothetical protein